MVSVSLLHHFLVFVSGRFLIPNGPTMCNSMPGISVTVWLTAPFNGSTATIVQPIGSIRLETKSRRILQRKSMVKYDRT